MNLEKRRILYFDFIKMISIFLVCFYHGHSLQLNYLEEGSINVYLNNFLVSFASMGVPLFFIINGSLMLRKDLDLKKHIKKTRKVFLLTITWIIITLIFTSYIYNNKYQSLNEIIRDFFSWPPGTLNHIWFLIAIVHIYILYPMLKILISNKNKDIAKYFFIITFIFTFGNSAINSFRHMIEFILNRKITDSIIFNYFGRFNIFYETYAYTIVYFSLGIILVYLMKKESIKKQKISILILALFILNGISLIHSIMVSNIRGNRYDPVWNGYETISTMLMAIVFFIITFKLEDKLEKANKIITLVGNNTLGIYLIHMLLLFKYKPIFSATSIGNTIWGNVIFTIIILSVSLLITLIIKKIPILKKLLEL